MFFNVDDRFSYAKVYGVKGKSVLEIDPHDILPTRFIGFDDVHRNVLGTILDEGTSRPFCRYIERKFPEFDNFLVTLVYYPSVVKSPRLYVEQPMYQCRE